LLSFGAESFVFQFATQIMKLQFYGTTIGPLLFCGVKFDRLHRRRNGGWGSL